MTHNEMPEFVKLMTGLGMLYGKPMNEFLIDIYWQALQMFTFEAVKTALQTHVQNPDAGQYLPKPADVVRYLEGSSHTQALQAWSLVARAIRTIGCYESVVFDDPVIHAVIADMGGWLELCRMTEKEMPHRAREFEKRYTAYVLHPPVDYPKQLVGLIEAKNSLQGFPVKPPLLLGDSRQAWLVYEQGSDYRLPAALLTHDDSQAHSWSKRLGDLCAFTTPAMMMQLRK
jgi:hypothetical protein